MSYKSEGFKGIQYKKIGKVEVEEILKKMDVHSQPKVKALLGMLSGRSKSLAKFHKAVKDKCGQQIASRFETVAEKHFGGGVTEEQKRRNLKTLMHKDTSFLDEQRSGRKKVNYSALGNVSARTKGQALDIGINRSKTGFASGNLKKSGFGGQTSTSKPTSPAKPSGAPPIIPLAR